MTATILSPETFTSFSEVLSLKNSQLNLMCFRLTPEIDRKDGNRLSYHFSRKLTESVVTWHKPYFWVLAASNRQLPSQDELRNVLASIQDEVEDFRERFLTFQWVRQPQITSYILAQLAVQVLNKTKFNYPVVLSEI